MSRWYADTEALAIERHGYLVATWEDDGDENAVPVHTLGWGCRAWQTEAQPAYEAVTEPMERDHRAAILGYLRANGESQAHDIARTLWRFGGLAVVRQRLAAMEREGIVWRGLTRGLWRLA